MPSASSRIRESLLMCVDVGGRRDRRVPMATGSSVIDATHCRNSRSQRWGKSGQQHGLVIAKPWAGVKAMSPPFKAGPCCDAFSVVVSPC